MQCTTTFVSNKKILKLIALVVALFIGNPLYYTYFRVNQRHFLVNSLQGERKLFRVLWGICPIIAYTASITFWGTKVKLCFKNLPVKGSLNHVFIFEVSVDCCFTWSECWFLFLEYYDSSEGNCVMCVSIQVTTSIGMFLGFLW